MTSRQNRKDLLYKAAIRRSTCIQILYINIAILTLLVFAVHTCINFSIFSIEVTKRSARDEPLLTKYKDMLSFYECPYRSPGEYSLKYCHEYCGKDALITRVHRLDKTSDGWKHANQDLNKPANCSNKLEILDCHESLAGRECVPKRTNITECAGLPGSNYTGKLDELSGIRAPGKELTNEDMNKIYMANELIIHCPTPQLVSEPFKIKYRQVQTGCLVKLATMEQGWPAFYKFCDSVQYSNVSNCSIVDDPKKKMR